MVTDARRSAEVRAPSSPSIGSSPRPAGWWPWVRSFTGSSGRADPDGVVRRTDAALLRPQGAWAVGNKPWQPRSPRNPGFWRTLHRSQVHHHVDYGDRLHCCGHRLYRNLPGGSRLRPSVENAQHHDALIPAVVLPFLWWMKPWFRETRRINDELRSPVVVHGRW